MPRTPSLGQRATKQQPNVGLAALIEGRGARWVRATQRPNPAQVGAPLRPGGRPAPTPLALGGQALLIVGELGATVGGIVHCGGAGGGLWQELCLQATALGSALRLQAPAESHVLPTRLGRAGARRAGPPSAERA